MHQTNTLSDALFTALGRHYTEQQLLDLALLAGWYHAISYAARVTEVEPEDGAPTFGSVLP